MTKRLFGAALSMPYFVTNGSAAMDSTKFYSKYQLRFFFVIFEMHNFSVFVMNFGSVYDNYSLTIVAIWTPRMAGFVFFARK